MLNDLALAKAIQDAIAKNLPSEIGNHLQARLNKAEEDAEEVLRLKSRVALLEGKLDKHDDLDRRQRAYDEAAARLAKERADFDDQKRHHDHKLEIYKIRQECAEKTLNHVTEVVETVFRAPVTKEIMVNTKSIPILSGSEHSRFQSGTATETHTDTKITQVGAAEDSPNRR